MPTTIAGRQQFQAGFHQQLFQERVAHLHRRALGLVLGVQSCRLAKVAPWMPSRPVSAPTSSTGLPTPSARARISSSCAHQAHAHRVDQRIAVVGRVEVDLAADGRHADAVAVARRCLPPRRRTGSGCAARSSGPKRSELSSAIGPRAHREDVAHDAAHARRRALVRLDRAGVVVALDLEDDRQPVADVHCARRSRPAPAARAAARSGSGASSGREFL